MRNKFIKIICSLLVFFVFTFSFPIETFAGNYYFSHIGTVSKSAMNTSTETDNYHKNWEYWSQGASKYSAMRTSGCRIAAQSKMLVEMGAASSDETIFNPDIYKEWATPKYFKESISENSPSGAGAIAYAKEKGLTVKNGYISLSGTNSRSDIDLVMEYINNGYYVILHSSAHQAYVGRAASIDAGEPVILDSRSDCSYKQSLCETYSGYTLTKFTRLYFYSVEGEIPDSGDNEENKEPSPDPLPELSVSATFEKDPKWSIGETNALLAARVNLKNALNDRVTETGIKLYDSEENLLAEKSETPNYSGNYNYGRMWFDANDELGIILTPGTDYSCVFHIVLDGEKFESDIYYFTTEGTPATYMLGDVNGDFIIDTGDSQRLYEHIVGSSPIKDKNYLLAADVNSDGNIDTGDSQRLYEHIVGSNPLT